MAPLGEQAEEIIKDPYIFDFVPASKRLKETELENALVQQITKLLLEFAGKLSFYLSAIDGELKSEKDNPTIGLVLCKGKDKLVAKYALKDINKPMGISGYKLSNKISDDLQENLPTIEDIESRVNN